MVYEQEQGDFTMAFAGDTFITRRTDMYTEERFLELADILRGADCSFTISESIYHRFESPPVAETGQYGTYVQCDPDTIADLKWLGIDMVSTANQHCFNFGSGGIMVNIANLDAHAMPHAGTGPSLTEAVAPAYLETPRGSVALIGVTLTVSNLDRRVGDARGPIPARPGANVVRHDSTNVVPRDAFDALAAVARGLGAGGRRPAAPDAHELTFGGQRYVVGDGFGRRTELNAFDLELNLRWIKEARRMAEWVVVGAYCLEGGATQDDPAPFAIDFAHACIDAGADAVYGTGPHRDRGIEIYKGKPIMYSLSTLYFQNELIKYQPNDLFERYGLDRDATASDLYDLRTDNDTRVDPIGFKSTLVEAHYAGRELVDLVLHPVDAGFSTGNRRMRGRPVIAEGETANEILSRMKELSEPLGTTIDISEGRGRIKVA